MKNLIKIITGTSGDGIEFFNNSIEECVICGELTPYKKNEDVNFRRWYVEGCGQLCQKCFNKTYSDET